MSTSDFCNYTSIIVKAGFWRLDKETDHIAECKDKPINCVGGCDFRT